jgi:hypothetical protein
VTSAILYAASYIAPFQSSDVVQNPNAFLPLIKTAFPVRMLFIRAENAVGARSAQVPRRRGSANLPENVG